MATVPGSQRKRKIDYPTGDGKPLAETPIHRENLVGLIHVIRRFLAGNPNVYVSGNMVMYYVEGDKHKHVSPDVFVTLDIPDKDRDAYFVWEEGKGPDFVVEFTSKKTKKEDLETKYELYQDVLHVREYFLFDPKEQYLKPSMKGYRLVEGAYQPIQPVDGRLPSEVLGLHLERQGRWLRLCDPGAGRWIATDEEAVEAAEANRQAAEARLQEALRQADEKKHAAEQREAQLLEQLEELRRRLANHSQGS
jgi:Uma2 family endonuclease